MFKKSKRLYVYSTHAPVDVCVSDSRLTPLWKKNKSGTLKTHVNLLVIHQPDGGADGTSE